MRLTAGVAIATNVIVLSATTVAFRTWLERKIGYPDLDMLGLSGTAWPVLALVATVAMAAGFASVKARIVALLVLTLLVGVVVDHGFGAFRDGAVSTTGAWTGGLMVLQCVAVAAGIVVSLVRGSAIRVAGTAFVAGIGLVVVVGWTVAAVRVAGPGPKEAAVRDLLEAVEGDREDRGWTLLGGTSRSGTSEAAYVDAVARADWETFRWHTGTAREVENDEWLVEVLVDGGLSAVPAVMFEEGIGFPLCVDGVGLGIGIWVETPILGPPILGSGAMTGAAERGECGNASAVPEAMTDPVRWSDEIVDSGLALEVWNRTQVDLFLVDDRGSRIDVPACGRASTSALAVETMVQVRAEDGYVFAFGGGSQMETTYLVILADQPSTMNGTPPLPPLPPCEGIPWIQRGE